MRIVKSWMCKRCGFLFGKHSRFCGVYMKQAQPSTCKNMRFFPPLTDDVRRIVREELEKIKPSKEQSE